MFFTIWVVGVNNKVVAKLVKSLHEDIFEKSASSKQNKNFFKLLIE